MTKAAYMQQRATYRRPQAMLWADNYGTLVPYPSTLNSITNSNFEVDGTGWGTRNGTFATSTAQYVVGTKSLLFTVGSSATSAGINIAVPGGLIPVSIGQTYTYSIYVRDVNTAKQYKNYIDFYDASNTFISGSGISNTNAVTITYGAWTRIVLTFTVPETVGTTPTVPVSVRPYTYSTTGFVAGDAGKQVYFDAALFQEASSENPYVDGTSPSYFYAPTGYDIYDSVAGDNFLILSDHNREAIDFKPQRIEQRKRMINGRMRSYHVADKLTISTSWKNLPSRSFSTDPLFDPNTGLPTASVGFNGPTGYQYTVDGGAGGADLLKWYEDHQGPFWVYLSYDKPQNFATDRYNHLDQYSEIVQMYISDFSWTVEKRGGSTFDLWNINVSLEEV